MTNRRAWFWVTAIFAGLAIGGGVIGASCASSHRSTYAKGFTAGFENAFLASFGVLSPGAKAVRKAGKCQNASVVSGEDIGNIGDAGVLDMDFVICILPLRGDEPECDDLSRAYIDAASPKRKFMVEVKRLAGDHMICQRTYDASGELLTDYLKNSSRE